MYVVLANAQCRVGELGEPTPMLFLRFSPSSEEEEEAEGGGAAERGGGGRGGRSLAASRGKIDEKFILGAEEREERGRSAKWATIPSLERAGVRRSGGPREPNEFVGLGIF